MEPSPKGTVMVIDDAPANLRLMEGMLQALGYRALAFPSAHMALRALDLERPNLVLLDLRMPEMDGLQACRELKSREQMQQVPVVFLSGADETDEREEARKCGGEGFLVKPVRLEQLEETLREHLDAG